MPSHILGKDGVCRNHPIHKQNAMDPVTICTNSSAITITLPASPTNGDSYIVKRAGSGAVTLSRGTGPYIRNNNGNDVSSIALATQGGHWLVYNSTLNKWIIILDR